MAEVATDMHQSFFRRGRAGMKLQQLLRCTAWLAAVLMAGTAQAQDKYGCRAPAPGTMATGPSGASCMPTGRAGDPFVFCTEGMPQHCWVPVAPLAGTWTPICYYVNYTWISTFEQICPRARSMGHWRGTKGGSPSTTPFVH